MKHGCYVKNFFTKIANVIEECLHFFHRFHISGKTHNSEDTGMWGENVVESFLRNNHYKILGRRVRIGRHAEIDIVARDGDVLVFVEVKTRKSENYGRPLSSVDFWKKRTLSRAAIAYLKRLNYPQIYFRFDVIEVIGSSEIQNPTIRHIKDAFKLSLWYYYPRRT